MAERRMFAKSVLHSDDFMSLPPLCQLLYFQLGLVADDEGFVNSTALTMRLLGATAEDLAVLTEKGYLLKFSSGVTLFVHWYRHNQIRGDRFHPTECTAEKEKVYLDENHQYRLKTEETPATPLVAKMATEVRLGEDSLVEDREDKDNQDKAKTAKSIIINSAESANPSRLCHYGPTGKVLLTAKEYDELKKELDFFDRRLCNFDMWLAAYGWEGEEGHYEILRNWEELAKPEFG